MGDDPQDTAAAEEEAHRLAREYVDLWESQIKALAGDEALTQVVTQTIAMMNAGAATMATAMQNMADSANGASRDSASVNAAATAATPGDAESDISKLTRRIAELEKRIDRLESGAKKSRRNTRKQS